jgi:hypothetical protein
LTEDIAVAFTATPSEHLVPGQPIDFVLTVTNLGDEPVTPVVLRSSFFLHEIQFIAQQDCFLVVSIADGEDFFVYFFSWYVAGAVGGPPLEAGESRACQFQMALTSEAPAEYPFTFGLSDSHSDSNPENDQVTLILRRGDILPTVLPVNVPVAMWLLGFGMVTVAGCAIRRRQGHMGIAWDRV